MPIDFDRALYERAREAAGGTDERVFEAYFDAQLEMLRALRPPVVGHFDLVRLLSDEPDGSLRRFEGVWERVVRNLEFVVGYGGVVEVNGSALRKGLREPYPQREVCLVSLRCGFVWVVRFKWAYAIVRSLRGWEAASPCPMTAMLLTRWG